MSFLIQITVTAKDGDPTKNNSLETSVSITVHVLDAQEYGFPSRVIAWATDGP